jgi:hypothetical protein
VATAYPLQKAGRTLWTTQMVRHRNKKEVMNKNYLIRSFFTLVGSLQVLLLVFIVAVSVRKPWGKCLSKQKEIKPKKIELK